jgi:hypothetical protein
VPPSLERIVLRAMAKAPGERFQTAAELAEALRAFARGEEMPGVAPGAPPAPSRAPADEAATAHWSWGQSLGPSPWATGQQPAPAPAAPAPPLKTTPYAAPAAQSWAPAAPAYTSPRWPLVLLGLTSLACVLGLVVLGALTFRQMHAAPPAPRVAPSGAVAPEAAPAAGPLASESAPAVVAAVRAVPDLWAGAAHALVPVPASGVTIRLPTSDEARDALLDQAKALATAGVAAAGEALRHQLTPRGAVLACEPAPPAREPATAAREPTTPAPDETCTAPNTARWR